jgi:hypothetical protein
MYGIVDWVPSVLLFHWILVVLLQTTPEVSLLGRKQRVFYSPFVFCEHCSVFVGRAAFFGCRADSESVVLSTPEFVTFCDDPSEIIGASNQKKAFQPYDNDDCGDSPANKDVFLLILRCSSCQASSGRQYH